MWLVGGGEVVEAVHQFMWKYKAGESVECMFFTKKPHMAVQCPAFVKARGSLCPHKNRVPKALANHTNSVQEC